MVNTRKSSQITSLEETLKSSPNFAVFQYEKVPHTSLESLRKELKQHSSRFKVIKNSIFQKALRHLGVADKKLANVDKSIKIIVGNSALMTFGEDWSGGLSAFHTFSDKEKGLTFKFGYLDQELYMKEDLEKIAKLPGRPMLMAHLIGTMKSPMGHLAYAMKFNMQKLAYILSSKAQSA